MNATNDLSIDRVRGSDRIASLDILRGIAILFILFMNVPGMGGYGFILFDFRYPTWTAADYWTTLFTQHLAGRDTARPARVAVWRRHPDHGAAGDEPRRPGRSRRPSFSPQYLAVPVRAGQCLLAAVVWRHSARLWASRRLPLPLPNAQLPRSQCALAAILLATLVLLSAQDYRERTSKLEQVERIEAAQAAGKGHQRRR